MTDATVVRPIHPSHEQPAHHTDHPLHHSRQPRWTQRATSFGVFGILALGAIYAGTSLVHDLMDMGPTTTILPFILLGVALLIALGFEFVNGFHDTANAVATVIYTH
jgi:inorganic phosphate transporter, PiT family